MALALVQPNIPDSTDFAGGLPLVTELGALLPGGILRRGGSVGISGQTGQTSLLLKLLAGPVANGSWVAVIGLPALGVEAANEFGVSLDRLTLVPDPGTAWLDVTAALLDAVDIVVLYPQGNCRPGDASRLLARARERHSVLVLMDGQLAISPSGRSALARWPQSPDLTLAATESSWSGLTPGHGTLHHCSISVAASGRRLPGPRRTGQVTTGQTTTGQATGRRLNAVAR